jgi:Histidine acid phosphatase.
VLIRHGDRTSFHYFPTVKSSRERAPGQLTGIGMMQEYMLGKKFRDELIAKDKFLSAHYLPNEIDARALALDRTLMSAQLF